MREVGDLLLRLGHQLGNERIRRRTVCDDVGVEFVGEPDRPLAHGCHGSRLASVSARRTR